VLLLVLPHMCPGSFGTMSLNRKIISSMILLSTGKEQLLVAKVITVHIISSKWILRAERFKPQ